VLGRSAAGNHCAVIRVARRHGELLFSEVTKETEENDR
jgi:hypothetical protein